MRILVAALPGSIHSVRWLSQVIDQGWDIHFFPSVDQPIHLDFRNITVHNASHTKTPKHHASVKFVGRHWEKYLWYRVLVKTLRHLGLVSYPTEPAVRLAALIDRLQPDIVHSLEFQHAGYLTLEARKLITADFPRWIATNWGSDIYLFGRLESHREKVVELLRLADYYSCECERDVALARQFGFTGKILPVMPNAGGFDLAKMEQYRQPGPVSERRLIILKGYQHWSGRGLFGLKAIEMCAELLQGYQVFIYAATEDVKIAAELMSARTGIPVEVVKWTAYETILQKFGSARVYIGVGISDGISTSMLEAMVTGVFPIQSNTACADEWLVHGKTGFIVSPEDPEEIAAALRRALQDDDLVNQAAERNLILAHERLDYAKLKPQAVAFYQTVFDDMNITEQD